MDTAALVRTASLVSLLAVAATLPIDDTKAITIRLPQSAQLIDDRHYNGSGYLLAFYPIAGEVTEGRQWSYTVEIEVGQTTRSIND